MDALVRNRYADNDEPSDTFGLNRSDFDDAGTGSRDAGSDGIVDQ